MKKIILLLITILSINGYSQNKETEKIENEGKLLFRMEKASWYSTDDFLERFKELKDSIGGYLSYETEDHKINSIFFSRFNENKVLARYQFDSLPKPKPNLIDTQNSNVTKIERELIKIRQDARNQVYQNTDKFFTFYENTSLNFIPLIKNGKRQVFILTGPQINGIVLLGNDYVLKYDKNNTFKERRKIHNSIIQLQSKSEKPENKIEQTIHSHVLSDYINSTDICTLLLYKNYVEWKKHIVISKKQVSIFDLEKEQLFTMTRKAWDKIYKSE